MLFSVVQGFILGLSMIVPIGAQNAYILNQGVKQQHHIVAATICMVCDFGLIVLGVYGGGKLISQSETLLTYITWAGIIFLVAYGLLSFRAIWREVDKAACSGENHSSLKKVIFTTLAVTLLNPHVYIDTIVILGSVGSQFTEQVKLFFTLGCMLASVVWFYSLSLGAAKLSPILSRKKVKQVIDFFIGSIMFLIAYGLLSAWLDKVAV
ncbi:LysE/ArgO family amino acid transporter [Aliikangiella sp. IMCC44359]|uniref:LysE/ArgO family amino acid transporter n=1 Tax=Aliikangiella sp. IMCC44359 TaxID=3459125 RepID=UPI00403AD9AC